MVYFGSPLAGHVCQAESAPGVDPVTVNVVDAASGSGSPASNVYLALTAGDLDTAVGGAPLDLPAAIEGGVANALAIHIRVLDTTHASGVHADLSLETNALGEWA